jgi:PKD repeat protein
MIVTGPTAVRGIAAIGEDVMFDVAAQDFNGDPLTYVWDFGDGSPGAGGTSPTHQYADAGRYTARVTVDDGFDTASGSVDLIVAAPMAIDKLKGKLNFKKPEKDSLLAQGSLDLAPDFSPDGVSFHLDVGGVISDLTLDAKGKAKTVTRKLKLKFKKKTGLWSFKLKIKKANLATAWADEGLTNETKEEPVSLEILLIFGVDHFMQMTDREYKAKQDKSGKFK